MGSIREMGVVISSKKQSSLERFFQRKCGTLKELDNGPMPCQIICAPSSVQGGYKKLGKSDLSGFTFLNLALFE